MEGRAGYDAFWATSGGIYLGIPTDRTEGEPPKAAARPLTYVGDRHLVTIGPNGSGKSRRLLLPNLARLDGWSILVVDPKGEHFRTTAAHRAARGSQIIPLDPFNAGGTGFNPVSALDPKSEDFPDDALGIAEALIRIEGNEPHFPQSAQEITAGTIMYSRLSEPDGGSLPHVRSLLSLPFLKLREEVERALAVALAHNCEEPATKLGRLMDAEPDNKEVNGVLSTFQAQTRWLDSRPIKRSLSARNVIDFTEMKQRPVTVYLILPANRLVTHSTWLRLMLAAVLQPLMRDARRGKVPVLLMLDEYFAIANGGLPIIENNMAMLRGYGIKLWTVFQDLAQAKRLYKEGFESFIGNAGVLQAFAPQDLVTADYLSARTGQTRKDMFSRSRGSSQNPDGSRTSNDNLSVSQNQMPLMLPQDLRNMDEGYSVLFSHKTKGTVRSYFPDPEELPDLAPLAALAP